MAEKLSTLPLDFDFIEDERANLTLVGAIRLDPVTNTVQLQATNGLYPTSGQNYVISRAVNPQAVRQWVGFQSFVQNVFKTPTTQTTGDMYRLSDGTNQWWWNGSAWAQSTSSWNTEADIANHIATFPVVTRTLAVAVLLTTTDPTVTPVLQLVRVAWTGKVNVFEDLVYRTLVPLFATTPIVVDFVIKVPMPGGLQLNVAGPVAAANNKFKIAGIDGIFNNNSDPGHYTDLLSSYNASTGIATLTTAIPVGQVALVRLLLTPQVAVKNTSLDYTEMELAPSIQLTNIESVDSQETDIQVGIVNKSTGVALRVQPPYRFNLRFTMIALAPGGVDLLRLLDALVELVETNPLITSVAMGEQYRLWLIDEFTDTTTPNDMNLHTMQGTFMIPNVLAFKKPTVTEKAITTVNATFNGESETYTGE